MDEFAEYSPRLRSTREQDDNSRAPKQSNER
jgi:hypothetical protein